MLDIWEGIAKAVKVLLDALGVWCVIAICGNNPEKGIKYRHTWNIVKINGTYYHLDDQQIFRDHEPLIALAPHCSDHDHFYYKEKKLSFIRQEDVYKRSLQAVLHIQYTDMNLQESVTMEEANEGERD